MSKGKRLAGGILLLALIALTFYLLLRNQPVSQLLDVLGRVKPGYVVLGLGLMFVFVGCEAMCSKLILGRLGHSLTYRRCLSFSFVGFYVSSITPSATGGQPAQIYYMSKSGVPAAHGALNMMMIAVCYQVTLPNAARRLMNGLLNLGVRLRVVRNRAAAEERLERQMAEYRSGAACFRQNAGLAPALLGLNAVQLTALFLVPFVVYKAFGLSGHGVLELVGAQALLTLATSSLPLPGAVGATEGGFVTLFALFFGAALVTPAVLVSRGISFYAFLLLSGLVTLGVHFAAKRWSGEKNTGAAAAGLSKAAPAA